jgi:sn-glycerol 3-phosphate transport system substrate-binding protein
MKIRLITSGFAGVLLAGSFVVLSPGAPPAVAATAPSCSPQALKSEKGPVQINFWESSVDQQTTVLQSIVAGFNLSQSKVHVNLVQDAGFSDTLTKIQAGLSNGELPDLAQVQDVDSQTVIDTGAFLPVSTCIKAFGYSTSSLLLRALSYWKIDGKQWALPYAVTVPVLFYNAQAFQKAGLDPSKPPTTLAQVVSDAKATHKAGQGSFGLKLDPWQFETWEAAANKLYVNNSNGRAKRATKVSFDNSTATTIFKTMEQLVSAGAARTNSADGADAFDNLLGMGSGKNSMTIDASSALGTINSVIAQYPNVTLDVAPIPRASASDAGAVQTAGSGIWISKRSSAAVQAGSFEFAQYFLSATEQASWATTGFIPLNTQAISSSAVQKLWTSDPRYRVAYTSLTTGVQDAATAGAVIGPFEDVRSAVVTAENEITDSPSTSVSKALSSAASQSNEAISSYNERIGG